MLWKDTWSGRTHSLEGHTPWKDTCSGRTERTHALEGHVVRKTHALEGHTLWKDTCSGRTRGPEDTCTGRTHALEGHMLWKDTWSGRTHALEGHMLWKDTCTGRTHALEGHVVRKTHALEDCLSELSVHCKRILIVGRSDLIFHISIWVTMKTAGIPDVTPRIITDVHRNKQNKHPSERRLCFMLLADWPKN
jgi:hypothetical protein